MCLGMANGCREIKKKYVYIIGHFSTPEDRKKFEVTKHLLMGDGYAVLSFADVFDTLPKLTCDDDYMHIRYAMIDLCSEVFVMKDWQDSPQTMLDFRYAVGTNKKIRYEE
jgi:hypothetical protein